MVTEEDIHGWQNWILDPLYLIVWINSIVFKVRGNNKVINKIVYLAIGLNIEGNKVQLGKNESSAFQMSMLTDLQAKGVQDILISYTDNLNGFTQTIRAAFPQSTTQICVVHQICSACRYGVWKDKKQFSTDMRPIYSAVNEQDAEV